MNTFLDTSGIESYEILDEKIIDAYLSDPAFPYLVSFPRTGSHWIRNVMELYFMKPALIRVFFMPSPSSFTCYHTHDLDLTVHDRESVLYLYRDPVATVYSQLKYHNEPIDSPERIRKWSEVYAAHLNRWMLKAGDVRHITRLCYENFKEDFGSEFSKICAHFDEAFDKERLENVLSVVSKDLIRKKVASDDEKVINQEEDYEDLRSTFKDNYHSLIFEVLRKESSELPSIFDSV